MKFKLELYELDFTLNADADNKEHFINVSGDYVHYNSGGYIFGGDDFEYFVKFLSKALNNKEQESFLIESIDLDFKIRYKPSKTLTTPFPNGYTRTYTTDEEFRIEIEFVKCGSRTDNILSMSIDKEEANALCNYFKYVLGILSNEDTLKMIKEGYFLKD